MTKQELRTELHHLFDDVILAGEMTPEQSRIMVTLLRTDIDSSNEVMRQDALLLVKSNRVMVIMRKMMRAYLDRADQIMAEVGLELPDSN